MKEPILNDEFRDISRMFKNRDIEHNITSFSAPRGTHRNLVQKSQAPRKKSLSLRIASLLAAGVLTIGAISLIKDDNKVPEPNDHIQNYAISLSETEKQDLETLYEEFEAISKDSSSSEINEFASKVRSYSLDYLKSNIMDIYTSKSSVKPASITVHRDTVTGANGPEYVYYADVHSPYSSNPTSLLLKGENLEKALDVASNLENFDVYHDGFNSLEKCMSTIKTLETPCVYSYDTDKNKITSYEVREQEMKEKPEANNINLNMSSDKEIDER